MNEGGRARVRLLSRGERREEKDDDAEFLGDLAGIPFACAGGWGARSGQLGLAQRSGIDGNMASALCAMED